MKVKIIDGKSMQLATDTVILLTGIFPEVKISYRVDWLGRFVTTIEVPDNTRIDTIQEAKRIKHEKRVYKIGQKGTLMVDEIKRLAAKYAKHGITENLLYKIMQRPDYGLTMRQRLIGMRLLLGNQYGEQEYFTVEEVAEFMGVSEGEAFQMMMESGANPIQISIIPGGVIEEEPGKIEQ